jgi:hypothetical protein
MGLWEKEKRKGGKKEKWEEGEEGREEEGKGRKTCVRNLKDNKNSV